MVGFKNRLVGLCLTVIILGTGSFMGHAQTMPPYDVQLITRKASTVDEVGIAFLKMTSNFPDFNKVVQSSDEYRRLDPLAQQDYQTREVGKLQSAFLAYAPKKSSLVLRVPVTLKYNRKSDGTSTLDIAPPSGGFLYFPYYFAGYPIALIINQIEAFQHIELNQQESDIVYGALGLDGAATLLLQVYPIAADDKEPVKFDNIKQYGMLADIGYIGLINARAEQIWAWKSNKYSTKHTGIGTIPPSTDSGQPLINLIPKKQ